MRHNLLLQLCLLFSVSAIMVGCGGDNIIKVGRLYNIELQTQQFAIDRDSSGSPDSVSLQIIMYGYHNNKLRAVMGTGRLDVNIFDGAMVDAKGNITRPLHTWKLEGEDLKQYISSTYGLMCFRMLLAWPPYATPRHNNVILQARYTSPDGIPIDSSPVEIKLKTGY